MCDFASAIYHRTAGLVYFQGVDSHTEIARRAGLRDQQNEFRVMPYVRLELVPSCTGANFEEMGPWKQIVDEDTTPEWFTESIKEAAFATLKAKVLEWIVPVEGAVYDEGGWRSFYDGYGKWHRDGGLPAVESPNGYKSYWVHGERHRDGDLPAIEYADGRKTYYVHGKYIRTEYPDQAKEQ